MTDGPELNLREAPEGFDEEFFAWLDEMTDLLDVRFASPGGIPEAEIAAFEAGYDPWEALKHWFAWDLTSAAFRSAIPTDEPLAPVDCRSYGSAPHTVAVLHASDGYEVFTLERRMGPVGRVARYSDLRVSNICLAYERNCRQRASTPKYTQRTPHLFLAWTSVRAVRSCIRAGTGGSSMLLKGICC